MSYPNIKAELKRNGASYGDVAKVLGMSTNNVSMKINGRVSLTAEEAKEIRESFCPDATLDYLLETPDRTAKAVAGE